MCVTFIFINKNDQVSSTDTAYRLIVVNNRDELYDRPTSRACWNNRILAGRDEKDANERGGTWMGVDRRGRVGVLLSILESHEKANPNAPSRGKIVNEYLEGTLSAEEYARTIAVNAQKYNGFQLLLIDRCRNYGANQFSLFSYNNRYTTEPYIQTYTPGIYGFGNSPCDRPFNKVQYGVELFRQTINRLQMGAFDTKDQLIDSLLAIVTDQTKHFPDAQLQSQCDDRPLDHLQCLSSLFVRFPPPHRYGTRCHTILLIDAKNHATYIERSLIVDSIVDQQWDSRIIEFDLCE